MVSWVDLAVTVSLVPQPVPRTNKVNFYFGTTTTTNKSSVTLTDSVGDFGIENRFCDSQRFGYGAPLGS